MTATLWTEAGWILLRADFCREAVDAWKARIPGKYRRWDPEQKLWKFDPSVAPELEAILKEHGYVINIVEQQAQQIVVQESTDQYKAFIDALPVAVLKQAYRQACIELHPDHGGSTEAMARLNAAWSVLKEERK